MNITPSLIFDLLSILATAGATAFFIVKKIVTVQTRVQNLEDRLTRLEIKEGQTVEQCRQGRIAIHEEVKALSRDLSKIQGKLE